jgi:RimJ/RimL family protein N-acetyltransferase
LVLRRWRSADRDPFASLNADPEVMRYFPAPLDRAASDAFVDRIESGFETFGYGLWTVEVRCTVDEIVSMTTPRNKRSRAVMQRLGMTRDPADDFEHPRLPEGHPLRPHVLYRIRPS